MARPTKSEFAQWDPAVLGRQADVVRAILEGVQKEGGEADGLRKALGEHIRGQFGTAVGEQAGVNVKSLQSLQEPLSELGPAWSAGAQTLVSKVNALREVQRSAAQQGFDLTEDWQLQDKQRPGMRRAAIQEDLQKRLDDAVKGLDQEDEQIKSDVERSGQALWDLPSPQFGLGQDSGPEQPPRPDEPKPEEPKPDDPKPEGKPQDQGQPGGVRDVGSEEKPGVTDVNDPGVNWSVNVEEWKKSWKNPQVADNPPGFTGGPGPERDQAWKTYLATMKPGTRGFLPNPDAVSDKGLQVVGHAAMQLGTSYAWAGGDMKGPGKGVLAQSPDSSWTYKDNTRTGFDCSGLTEYAAGKVTGSSIGGYTEPQLDSPKMHDVGPGETPQPGDFVYYGPDAAHRHVGIYVAPGVIINAPESGRPVELDNRGTSSQGSGEHPVRVRRLN